MSNLAYFEKGRLNSYDLIGILTYETVLCGIANPDPVASKGADMSVQNFSLVQGDNRTVRVYVKTPELDIVNVAGAVGELSVREDSGETPLFTLSTANVAEGTIGSTDQGEMLFYFIPSVTNGVTASQYYYDVVVTLSGNRYTVLRGIFEIVKV